MSQQQPATIPFSIFFRRQILVPICLTAVTAAVLSMSLSADEGPKTQDEKATADEAKIKFFEKQVKPILVANCYECHGLKGKAKGGLRLISLKTVLKGGETGPAVSTKEPAESLLLEAINYDGLEMPPKGKLPQKQIDILTRWVKMGVPWTRGDNPEPEPAETRHPPEVNEQTKRFWSFQKINRPDAPAVKQNDWVTNPIDAFILSKLERAGLAPSKRASKTERIRRAYYNLTGLPPEPNDVAGFLADDSPNAFEKVVDRLLESPHYGERWGRHWLDLVRYAETNSYERDGAKPFVWKYRDYVIRSFNDDKPYDQFVREQLAGDELETVTPETIIATGYYRLGIWDDEPSDPEQAFYDDLDDILSTTGQVFLGLTVGCARCHDHKLDPIPQKDYYRLLAFFRNIRRYGDGKRHATVLAASVRVIAPEEDRRRHVEIVAAHKEQLKTVQDRLKEIERIVRKDLTGIEKDEFKNERARVPIMKKRIGNLLDQKTFDEYSVLTKKRNELRRFQPPGLDQALCVKERGAVPPPTHLLIRGNAHAKGPEVQPGFPSVLSPPEPVIQPAKPGDSSGRRLALANWLTSRANPLTARVIVNRIWQHHFGRGIVPSPNNLGFQGRPPTHPALLDWLAAELISGGWKLKRLHKLIMLSSAYSMSSRSQPDALSRDPQNDLLWRFNMRRLEAEEVRDSILAVNGSLNRKKMYGPSIYTVIPREVLQGQSRPGAGWGSSSPEDRSRRSVYIHVKRSLVPPILASFDAADLDATCPVRFSTTQPTQALGMLNSKFTNDQTRVFADYLRKNAGNAPAEQVRLALKRTTQREPAQTEVDRGVRLMAALQREYKLSAEESLKHFCTVALNLNEFLYLD